jgi:hypothetical protein
MEDYESLKCLEIKQILKKHKITGYSKLCKQELVKLVKKILNNNRIKKGGAPRGNENLNRHIKLGDEYINKKKIFFNFVKEKLESDYVNRINIFLTEAVSRKIPNTDREGFRIKLLEEIEKIRLEKIRKEEKKFNNQQINQILFANNQTKINSLFIEIQRYIEEILNIFIAYHMSRPKVNNE